MVALATSGLRAQSNALNPTGNVGIGTTNPQWPLDIHAFGARIMNGNGNAAQLDLIQTNGGRDWALVSWGSAAGGGTLSNSFSIYDGTVGAHRLNISGAGRVGIGTTAPEATLHVHGNFRVQGGTWTTNGNDIFLNGGAAGQAIYFRPNGDGSGVGQAMHTAWGVHAFYDSTGSEQVKFNNGVVGIGKSPNIIRPLTVRPATDQEQFVLQQSNDPVSGWAMHADVAGGLVFKRYAADILYNRVVIDASGNVGIGTASPSQKLSVNGTVRAKEVVVETTGWSDYVFADDYDLRPLSEVESHIKAHRHLPGIPSAAQVAEHGVSVGEMQAKLLAKVEELTLHAIAQQKEIELLRAEVRALRDQE
jgi:hypothetical protein